jgi:FtsP/CotA-like multicopper oxidase with cupredoxin domain
MPRTKLPFPTGAPRFTEALPTMAELGVVDATAGGSATITMVSATHTFHPDLAPTPTFAYRSLGGNQTYLGPVIVAKQGTPFDLTVVNSLGIHPLAGAIDDKSMGVVPSDPTFPRASTHLHGGNSAPGMDGDPTATFTPGSSFTYRYGNTQEAAGLWYHDQALGIARLNVLAGLAGAYLLRNADDDGSGTRLPGGRYEMPLVIQDRKFLPNGKLDYQLKASGLTMSTMGGQAPLPGTRQPGPAPEFFGDVSTVNGIAWPNLDVDRGKYRFRVYNGSNARFYRLTLRSGPGTLTFFQIGTDGGLLNAPVPLTRLLLGPGERADLVVDFAALAPGTKVVVTNDARAPFPNGPRDFTRGGPTLPQIMQFTVTSASGWLVPLPGTEGNPQPLRAIPITPLATPARPVSATRSMTLVQIVDPARGPLIALLNNRNFAPLDRTTTISTNTLEQWELINTTGDAHPIHLHFTQFQVLNRQKFDSVGYVAAAYPAGPAGGPPLQANSGQMATVPGGMALVAPPPVTSFLKGDASAPAAHEQGWKDTVVAMPGEVTRILVPFGANAAGSVTAFQASHGGDYVWHSSILEHQDHDMMQRFHIAK